MSPPAAASAASPAQHALNEPPLLRRPFLPSPHPNSNRIPASAHCHPSPSVFPTSTPRPSVFPLLLRQLALASSSAATHLPCPYCFPQRLISLPPKFSALHLPAGAAWQQACFPPTPRWQAARQAGSPPTKACICILLAPPATRSPILARACTLHQTRLFAGHPSLPNPSIPTKPFHSGLAARSLLPPLFNKALECRFD